MFSLKVSKNLGELPITPGEWNQLVSQNEVNTVFQTWEWFESWWNVFGPDNRLYIISVHQHQEVVGIASLMIEGRFSRTVKFVGDGKADYCDFIVKASAKSWVLGAMLEQIVRDAHLWDSVTLNNIPEESSTHDLLKEACVGRRIWLASRVLHVCPAVVEEGDGEEISKRIKKATLTRRFNYLAKSGELEFFCITDEEVAVRYLEIFFEQHIERWSARERPSLFLEPKNRRFYRELVGSLLEKGWLLFSVLKYNGEPIAFHFGFDYNARIVWYKPSFDVSHAKRSPGKVLLRFLLQYALERKREELDFTIGDEPFKDEFANKKRRNLQVKIFRSLVVYRWEGLLHHLRRSVKRGGRLQLDRRPAADKLGTAPDSCAARSRA